MQTEIRYWGGEDTARSHHETSGVKCAGESCGTNTIRDWKGYQGWAVPLTHYVARYSFVRRPPDTELHGPDRYWRI